MSVERLGVFGGTFDPPHIAHLILAAEACAGLRLDRLLWVLTPDPPHKLHQSISPVKHRLAMLEMAIQDQPSFELSSIEMERSGPHYTVDTLSGLAHTYPSAHLILIIGGDSLHDLPTWYRPSDILAACREIGVFRRPGDSIDLSVVERSVPGTQAKVRFVDAPLLEIAASDIRRRIREDLPFRYFLPPSVFEYIIKHKLYR